MNRRSRSTLQYGKAIMMTLCCVSLVNTAAFLSPSRSNQMCRSTQLVLSSPTRLATSLSVPPAAQGNQQDDQDDNQKSGTSNSEVSGFRSYLHGLEKDIGNKRMLAKIMDEELSRMERRWYQPNVSYLTSPKSYDGPAVQPDVSIYSMVASAYVRAGGPQGPRKAEGILQRCEEHGLQPSVIMLSNIMNAWAKADDWYNANRLLKRMEREYAETGENAPNVVTYSSYLEALSASRRKKGKEIAREARDMMDRMYRPVESGENVHARPNAFTYVAVMKCMEQAREGVEPIEALLRKLQAEYQQSGDELLKPKVMAYTPVMNAWSRCGGGLNAAKRADALLRELRDKYDATGDHDYRPREALYTSVITAYARVEGDGSKEASDRVDELLHEIEQDPFVPDPSVHVYTAVINAKLNNGGLGGADEAACILRRAGRPDSIAYQCVIKAYAREGRALKAEELLDELEDLALHSTGTKVISFPDVVTFAACIHAWGKDVSLGNAVAVERADALVRRIAEMYRVGRVKYHHVNVNEWVFNDVLKLWSISRREDAGERAEQLIDVMEGMAQDKFTVFAPNNFTFVFALDSWAHSTSKASGERALSLIKRMKDAHAKDPRFDAPNVRALSAALISITRTGDPVMAREAESIFLEMMQLYQDGDRSSIFDGRTLTNVLRCIVQSRMDDWGDRTMRLLREVNRLNDSGIKAFGPSTIAYNCVLHGFVKEGSAKRAEELFHEMKERSDNGDRNVRPDILSYASLVKSWIKSGSPTVAQKARAVFNEVDAKYVAGDETLKPDLVFFNTVIRALTSDARRDPQSAERAAAMLERIEKYGVRPDILTYSAVCALYARTHSDAAVGLADALMQKVESLASSGMLAQPATAFYSSVMLTYTRSKTVGSRQKAEALLKHVDALYAAGQERCKPTTHIINILLGGWATSVDVEKVEKTCALLERMKDTTVQGTEPDTYSYNWVILAAARSSARTPEMRRKHFDVALENFRALHQSGDTIQPNEYTYSYFLKACNHLLSDGNELNKLVDKAFRLARQSGLVSHDVLVEVNKAQPSILATACQEDGSGRTKEADGRSTIPKSWHTKVLRRNRPR